MIYLVRHGQTNDNLEPIRVQGWTDTPLNDAGVAQARQLAVQLSGSRIEVIYSSPLSRALDTAKAVGTELEIEPVVDQRLAEGFRGEWEGRLFEEIEADEPELYASWMRPDPDFRFPGGESLKEHRVRVLEALREIAGDDRDTLVVAHRGTIRMVLIEARALTVADFHTLEAANVEPVGLTAAEQERLLSYSL